MILDSDIREQLAEYLKLMEGNVLMKINAGDDLVSKEMLAFVEEIAAMSSKISYEHTTLPRKPSFTIDRSEEETGIVFAGIPMGHEFTSLILALLQVSGRPPKVDDRLISRVKGLQGKLNFETYISLSCHNCPEVVQALNIMSLLNPNVTHTMIDGAINKEEVDTKGILAVPAVYLNGELFGTGRMSLEEILDKTGVTPEPLELEDKEPYDVLVIGGGPAGASAAIYAARKGIHTGIVAERFGGQVLDTLGIENFISVIYTEGPKLASSLEEHVKYYDVDIISSKRAKQLSKREYFEIELEKGGILKSRSIILATGARWRKVGVPGEAEFKNRGVAYCPHCDGPLFKDKRVAVIGGGNSGIEAAIDLAGIARHVTVLEFLPELKADSVLTERLYSLSNVTVLKNVQTKEITGTDRVNGITYRNRETQEDMHIEVEGVFVQIGLVPNTDWLGDTLERNQFGEIVVDHYNATSVTGVFAAGDCTNNPYKQIIISMGSGAGAALSAFDYLIRNQI